MYPRGISAFVRTLALVGAFPTRRTPVEKLSSLVRQLHPLRGGHGYRRLGGDGDGGYVVLGNRVLSLLSALLYARLSGRHLLVDWRDGMYAEEGVNAFSHLFQSRWATPVRSSPVTDSVTPSMWRGR